jgi:hypothetical protein
MLAHPPRRIMVAMYIAIDFDGTIVEHQYPEIGRPAPGAFTWLKKFQEAGAKLILWTMRCDDGSHGETLKRAVEFCRANGVEFYGVNCNPSQASWTKSPKAYSHIYIDDAAFGCPLRESAEMGARPMVNWDKVGPAVYDLLISEKK